MRIAALLSWYDEERATLRRAITSAARAGCTHLVAVDGRYAMYDAPRALSPHRQRQEVVEAAIDHGLHVTLDLPTDPWETEMEKRTHLFALAATLPVDWLLVLDADFEVRPCLLPALLAPVGAEVAQVELLTPPGPGGSARFGPPPSMPFRCLYRQGVPIVVGPNHYTYTRPMFVRADGQGRVRRFLWGNDATDKLVPAADLTGHVQVVHHTYHRPKPRVAAQFDYYRARDRAGIEAGPCLKCRERPATMMVPAGVKELADDRDLSIGWAGCCDACAGEMVEAAVAEAMRLGADEASADKLRQMVTPMRVSAPTS